MAAQDTGCGWLFGLATQGRCTANRNFRWVSLHSMCPGKTPLDMSACSPSLCLRGKEGDT